MASSTRFVTGATAASAALVAAATGATASSTRFVTGATAASAALVAAATGAAASSTRFVTGATAASAALDAATTGATASSTRFATGATAASAASTCVPAVVTVASTRSDAADRAVSSEGVSPASAAGGTANAIRAAEASAMNHEWGRMLHRGSCPEQARSTRVRNPGGGILTFSCVYASSEAFEPLERALQASSSSFRPRFARPAAHGPQRLRQREALDDPRRERACAPLAGDPRQPPGVERLDRPTRLPVEDERPACGEHWRGSRDRDGQRRVVARHVAEMGDVAPDQRRIGGRPDRPDLARRLDARHQRQGNRIEPPRAVLEVDVVDADKAVADEHRGTRPRSREP